jgi:hypothetical protein
VRAVKQFFDWCDDPQTGGHRGHSLVIHIEQSGMRCSAANVLTAFGAALKTQTSNLQTRLERPAVAPGFLFIESTVTGKVAGKRLVLPNAGRFTLHGILVREGVACFDELALRALTNPRLGRFASRSFGKVSMCDIRGPREEIEIDHVETSTYSTRLGSGTSRPSARMP